MMDITSVSGSVEGQTQISNQIDSAAHEAIDITINAVMTRFSIRVDTGKMYQRLYLVMQRSAKRMLSTNTFSFALDEATRYAKYNIDAKELQRFIQATFETEWDKAMFKRGLSLSP